jgi:hypothetical protein
LQFEKRHYVTPFLGWDAAARGSGLRKWAETLTQEKARVELTILFWLHYLCDHRYYVPL